MNNSPDLFDPFVDVKKNHVDTSKTPDVEYTLTSKNTKFTDKEIKKAKKKLKKNNIPKEYWFIDIVDETDNIHYRYWLS